ncbi:hypothetical protein EBR43_10590 [bacterium]|nr:hypothetical protein [bacterium]
MDFKSFLKEEHGRHMVFTYMRANPPTTGHGLVINKVKDIAKENKADHKVILSHSHDAKKNPLPPGAKVKHAQRMFPNTNIEHSTKEHPTFLHHLDKFHQDGYKHVTMVVGSDREEEMRSTIEKYKHPDMKVDVVSAGHRDPDAEGVTGVSGTKQREHATNNDFKKFKKGVPSHVSDEHAKELFHDLRKGMKIEEQANNVDIRELYVQGKVFLLGEEVSTTSGKTGFIVYRGTTYVTIEEEDGSTSKHWLKDIQEKKYYTDSGAYKQRPSFKDFPDVNKKNAPKGVASAAEVKKNQDKAKEKLKKNPDDPSLLEPWSTDKGVKTKPSVYTLKAKRMFGEQQIPYLLMNASQRLALKEEKSQITYNGYSTRHFDMCKDAQTLFTKLINQGDKNPDKLMQALQATDQYLGIEKKAQKDGFANEEMIHLFLMKFAIAHDTLNMLGIGDDQLEFMRSHLKAMSDLSIHKDGTFANEPMAHVPTFGMGEIEEDVDTADYTEKEFVGPGGKVFKRKVRKGKIVTAKPDMEKIDESAEKGLAAKASASGVSIGTLRKVYSRGMAAWRNSHRPGTTPQQWGMARVNSYITKGKTYHTADKDLREADETISPLSNKQPKDRNFSPDKDAFHGVDKTIDDQGYPDKPVGLVSFKSFTDNPESQKVMAAHASDRESIHRAQVQQFTQPSSSYKSMSKKQQLEP